VQEKFVIWPGKMLYSKNTSAIPYDTQIKRILASLIGLTLIGPINPMEKAPWPERTSSYKEAFFLLWYSRKSSNLLFFALHQAL
jgi:hypothetical protein